MKKLVIATCTALLLSFGLTVTNFPVLTTTVEAKALEYNIYLKPGESYQLGYGRGYHYDIRQYTAPNVKPALSVTSSGLVTASENPTHNSDGFAGDIWVIDRYGNLVEDVEVYIIY